MQKKTSPVVYKPVRPFSLRGGLMVILLIALMVLGSVAEAEMQRIEEDELATIHGKEGLSFTLNNFLIEASTSDVADPPELEFTFNPNGSDNKNLRMQGLTLEESGACTNGCGVTTGAPNQSFPSTIDPMTLDFEGTNDGFIALELPSDPNYMERNDVIINDVEVHDGSYSASYYDIGELRISDAQYAGGTRFAVGPKSNDGLRIGIAIELNGDLTFRPNNDFSRGIDFFGLHGANTYCPGGGCSDNDSSTWGWSGPLTWANLPNGRPLTVDFDYNSNANNMVIEFNPDRISPSAGTIGIENAWQGNRSFGESLIEDVRIRHLRIVTPQP